MKKGKLFIENMLIFGLGGTLTKIIPIIMVPVLMRILPDTSYYGLSDLCSTILSFGSAVAVMGMYDAMFRLFFEKEDDLEYQKQVCSTAVFFTMGMSITVCITMFLFRDLISTFVFRDSQFTYLVGIAAVGAALTGTNTIISAPTRMQNKRKTYILISALTPIISYTTAITLIMNGYYIIGLPCAVIFSDTIAVLIYYVLNRKWFVLKKFNYLLLKPLLSMAVPLFPTFLIYWVFNSSDKIMISAFLGIGQVGIYTAGSKLGHCSQIIYTAFAGGWSYFAFKTMKDSDQVEIRSKVLEYLGIVSFFSSILVFALSKSICELFFVGNYVEGYIVAPYLFMAPLTLMLFQVVANQFTIIKKTWLTTLTLTFGACINILFNSLFIPKIGIEGAAIASLLGYAFSTVSAILILLKMNKIIISRRLVVSVLTTMLYIFTWRFIFKNSVVVSLITALLVGVIFFLLFIEDLIDLYKTIRKR